MKIGRKGAGCTQPVRVKIFDQTRSLALKAYIRSISSTNKLTAHEYYLRLVLFEKFVYSKYNMSLDSLIGKLRVRSIDPYEVLCKYMIYQQDNSTISTKMLKLHMTTAKNLLEYNDIDISPRKFRLKVKIHIPITISKEAEEELDKITFDPYTLKAPGPSDLNGWKKQYLVSESGFINLSQPIIDLYRPSITETDLGIQVIDIKPKN